MDFSVVTEVFQQYGLVATLLGVAVVILTGAVKLLFKKQLEKLQKEDRKPVYEAVCIVWSALLSLVYFLCSKGQGWQVYGQEAFMTYTVAKLVYPLYENFKLRDFLQFVVAKAEMFFGKR